MIRASAVKRSCIVLACAVAVIAIPAQAAAQFAVVAVDDTRTDTRDIVRTAAENLLNTAKLDVLPDTADAAKNVLACVKPGNIDQSCASDAMDMASLPLLLHIRVTHTTDAGGQPLIELTATVFDREAGDWREKSARCAGCYDRAQLTDLVNKVCAPVVGVEPPATDGPTGVLDVRTRPADAQVFLDDKLLGNSGKTYQVPAGKHRVRVEKVGYQTLENDVEIAPSETQFMQFELRRQTGGNGHVEPPGDSRFGALKWLSLAGGVTFTTLGVIAIAIDDRDRYEGDKLQPEKFRTLPHGIASVIVGAALLGGAVYMFLGDRADPATEGVSLQLYDGGFGLGVAGSF